MKELMSKVFELVVKEGVFSYTTVHAEVQHFFLNLGLHPIYFEHFTALQIAKHIQCLIAAKKVADATEDMGGAHFTFKSEHSGFFLSAIDHQNPTDAQRRTEEKVSKHLNETMGSTNPSLIFMAS